MKVLHRQLFSLTCFKPAFGRTGLTLLTVVLATRIVGNLHRLALVHQRNVWPPISSLRQRSIAEMTFSCSRLICPALALRHAGAKWRNMSATSNFGIGATQSRKCNTRCDSGPITSVQDLGSHLAVTSGSVMLLVSLVELVSP